MKKLIILMTAASISLSACSQEEEINTKEGSISKQDIIDQISEPVYGKAAFDALSQKLIRTEYKGKIDEKKIKKQVEAEIKGYGGKEKFEKLIQRQQPGMDTKKYEQMRINAAYNDQFINDNIKIDDKFLKENVRHVLTVSIPVEKKDDLQDAEKKAEAAVEVFQKNKKVSSEEFTKKVGKNIFPQDTYVVKGQAEQAIEKAIFKMKEGAVSEPIKTSRGYEVFKSLPMTKMDKSTESQMKMQVRQTSKKSIKEAYKKLFKKYNVKYKNDTLEKSVNQQLEN